MNAILSQLSVAVGVVLFAVALAIGLVRELPPLVILFRAAIVMGLSVVISGLFFRFFTGVLYRFVAQRMRDFEEAAESEAAAAKGVGDQP